MNLNRRTLVATAAVAVLVLPGLPRMAHAETEAEARAKAMVAKAIELYDEKGDAAFKIFEEGKASGFLDGDVYIVVQSRGSEGKVLAHAVNPKLDGVLLDTIADPTGKKFGVIMSKEATEAGGWFDYEWPDPSTGKLGQKTSWAVLHKDLVFIAGFYVR